MQDITYTPLLFQGRVDRGDHAGECADGPEKVLPRSLLLFCAWVEHGDHAKKGP